jgi:hypothetical protein
MCECLRTLGHRYKGHLISVGYKKLAGKVYCQIVRWLTGDFWLNVGGNGDALALK